MTRMKTLLLTGMLVSSSLLATGCIGGLGISNARLFSGLDFLVGVVAGFFGVNVLGGVLPGLGA